jgi:hypothetical protein
MVVREREVRTSKPSPAQPSPAQRPLPAIFTDMLNLYLFLPSHKSVKRPPSYDAPSPPVASHAFISLPCTNTATATATASLIDWHNDLLLLQRRLDRMRIREDLINLLQATSLLSHIH